MKVLTRMREQWTRVRAVFAGIATTESLCPEFSCQVKQSRHKSINHFRREILYFAVWFYILPWHLLGHRKVWPTHEILASGFSSRPYSLFPRCWFTSSSGSKHWNYICTTLHLLCRSSFQGLHVFLLKNVYQWQWKSPRELDSLWYGYCFNLAKFTLYPSWHIFGCVFAWRWWMFTQCMAIRIATTRSATSFVFAICACVENFFSIPANSS